MSYKVYLWDSLSSIEWSQAVWKIGGEAAQDHGCEEELTHDVVLEHLPKSGLIVDAGCGIAKWPIHLRRRGYRCLGIEISREACHLAREQDREIPLIQGDTRQSAIRYGSVDAIVSLGVVEHDEAGPLESLRELRRVLKRDGLLVLAVPFNNLFRRAVWNPLHARMTERRRQAQIKLGFAEYRFSYQEMRGFLRASGFEIERCYPNDLRPPRSMGLWVDLDHLRSNPLVRRKPEELFHLTGLSGRLAAALVRLAPWAVCGEIVFLARAR